MSDPDPQLAAGPDGTHPLGLGRRAFLAGLGGGAGLLLARGLGAGRLPGASQGEALAYPEALRQFAASLTPGQRKLIVLPADHPSRQITNTIAFLDRPHLGTLLSPGQRLLAERLYQSMVSTQGLRDFAGTLAVEGRFGGCVLAIYGEPERGHAQTHLMGGHIHVRGGGISPEGAAFGGAVAYGHQVGNLRWRVEGNSFAYHSDAANQLHALLSADDRERAIVAELPHELMLQPQTADAAFPGVRFGALSEAGREQAGRLLDTVFSGYPRAQREQALGCIEANGGTDELHIAYFASRGFYQDMTAWSELGPEERVLRGQPYWQVWRIEGPGTVIHFKGYPHVHAYINVVRDPRRANLGESLGEVDSTVEGDAMRRLLEAALRRATGTELAWYGPDVPGRFCPGVVTSGLAYALDPYGNRVVVATLKGSQMAPVLRERLEADGTRIAPDKSYRVASTGYLVREHGVFGDPERVEKSDLLVRDALLAHLRAGGLTA